MKNPLNRLFFFGIWGLGVSTAMIVENYVSKHNTLWEYVIGFTLLAFSLVFLIARFYIIRKNK